MTKQVDLDELEHIATEADQDEWHWRPGEQDALEGKHDAQVVMHASEDYETREPCITCSVSNRAHIAAASPPVVLALTARIRELEAEVHALRLAEIPERNQDAVWESEVARLTELVGEGVVLR